MPDPDQVIDEHEIEESDGDGGEEEDTNTDLVPDSRCWTPVSVTGEV